MPPGPTSAPISRSAPAGKACTSGSSRPAAGPRSTRPSCSAELEDICVKASPPWPPSGARRELARGGGREVLTHDVFVLTHYAREPVAMAGGTTFHFVTDGIESALERARAAAGGADVRLRRT